MIFSKYFKWFSICLSFATLCSFYQINPSNKSIIIWKDSVKLTWNDFKAQPINKSKNSAISSVGISSKPYNLTRNNFEIDIIAYFDKHKSWVKPNEDDEIGLKHEQGHFDIGEIYARKQRKLIMEADFKKGKIDKKLKEIYDKNIKEKEDEQIKYDKETDHHRNKVNQEEWNKKISIQLNELKQYSASHLVISYK